MRVSVLILFALAAQIAAAQTASGLFLAPYKRRLPAPAPSRYCAMDDFTAQIRASGGRWAETEILGNVCLVKVRASSTLLTTIAATSGFFRIPLDRLDAPLSSLSTTQRNNLRSRVLVLGYTSTEFNTAIPNLAAATLGDVLRFAARRRLQPRYDVATDTIVLDGLAQPVRPIESVDQEVP